MLDDGPFPFSNAAQAAPCRMPLALMLGLCTVKFGAGMSWANQPGLRESPLFAVSISAAYGLFSGVFLGRAMALWALARRSGPQPV